MTKLVAVYSMKGGVGKTTIAANLAYSAHRSSLKTLLWDIDAQGSASYLLGQEQPAGKAKRLFLRQVEPATLIVPTRWPGLDLLAADLSLRRLDWTLFKTNEPKRLRKLLQGLAPDYDRIVLDCPPGLNEISDQLFRAVSLVVVPVLPTPLAMRSLLQVKEHLERNHERRPRLLPVISMVDMRKNLHREFVAAHPHWPVIPQASIVERMAVERSPVAAYSERSTAAQAFARLWGVVEASLIAKSNVKRKPSTATLARIPGTAR